MSFARDVRFEELVVPVEGAIVVPEGGPVGPESGLPPLKRVALPSGPGLFVHAAPDDIALMRRFLAVVLRSATDMRALRDSGRLDRLVETLIAGEPVSRVDEAIELDNAALRARYLETVPTWTAADLHKLAGSSATNRSALASGWKKEGRVFAVPYAGTDRFPAFQFADGQPKPVVRKVLAALPRDLTPWQVAFWFAGGSGWLDDATPQERLDDPDAVIAAARRLGDPAAG